MSKHTKGPWVVREGAKSKSVHNLIIEGDMTSVATIHGSVDCAVDWYAGASHLDANANLIAAAPDLLEALLKFREAFVIAAGDKSPFCKLALSPVDEAIAKARGES